MAWLAQDVLLLGPSPLPEKWDELVVPINCENSRLRQTKTSPAAETKQVSSCETATDFRGRGGGLVGGRLPFAKLLDFVVPELLVVVKVVVVVAWTVLLLHLLLLLLLPLL